MQVTALYPEELCVYRRLKEGMKFIYVTQKTKPNVDARPPRSNALVFHSCRFLTDVFHDLFADYGGGGGYDDRGGYGDRY